MEPHTFRLFAPTWNDLLDLLENLKNAGAFPAGIGKVQYSPTRPEVLVHINKTTVH